MAGGLDHAVRALARTPWYTLASVGVIAVSLALGTTVFAMVDGTLFKPLPYPGADRLFVVSLGFSKLAEPYVSFGSVSEAVFLEWRRALPTVPMTAFSATGDRIVGEHSRVGSGRVDEEFFDVMGQRPWLGGFSRDDFLARPAAPSALVSYDFWQRRLGAAADVVGRRLLDAQGNGIRVAGVLPRDFLFPYPGGLRVKPDVLVPDVVRMPPSTGASYTVIVRLPRAMRAEDLSARLEAVFAGQVAARPTPRLDPTADARRRVIARGYDRLRLDPLRPALTARYRDNASASLAAAVTLVLLACLNVAGLTIARARARGPDLVVRRALGALTIDLVALLAIENAAIIAAGTAIGAAGARVLLSEAVPYLKTFMAVIKPPVIDWRVVVGVTGAAACCSALVTLLSARAIARASALATANERGTTRRERRGRSIVALELALGLVLAVAGSLVTGSLIRTWQEDPGFDVRDTALVSVLTPAGSSAQEVEGFITTLSHLPGVAHVGSSAHPLLDSAFNGSDFDRPPGVPLSTDAFPIESVPVSHGFIEAAGLPLHDGRLPTDAEFMSGAGVIVVSDTTAHEFWPGRDAVGQSLVRQGRVFTVVGVVGDARFMSLDLDAQGEIYWPVAASEHPIVGKVLVRFSHPDRTSLPRVISDITERCPGCWLFGAEMLHDALSASIQPREFSAGLFAAFGLAALVIVGAGVLGVVAMTTNGRTREIGIRMALGATRHTVVLQIVREQIAPVVVGLAAGAVIAAWATRFVTAYLYKTTAYDPWSWIVAVGVLAAIAMTAALVPSRRASRIDPVQALRAE